MTGVFLSAGILKNTAFREFGLFRSSDEAWETPTLLGLLERDNPQNKTLTTEIGPVSETLCSSMFYRIPDDGQSPRNPAISRVIHHRQKLLESRNNSVFWNLKIAALIYLFLLQRKIVHPKVTFSEIASQCRLSSILRDGGSRKWHKKVTARRDRSTSYTCTDVEVKENP